LAVEEWDYTDLVWAPAGYAVLGVQCPVRCQRRCHRYPVGGSDGGDSGGGTGVSGGGERGSGSVYTTVRRPRLRTELVERSGTLSSGHACFERLDLYQYSTRAAYPQQRRTPPPRQSAAADKSSNSRG